MICKENEFYTFEEKREVVNGREGGQEVTVEGEEGDLDPPKPWEQFSMDPGSSHPSLRKP